MAPLLLEGTTESALKCEFVHNVNLVRNVGNSCRNTRHGVSFFWVTNGGGRTRGGVKKAESVGSSLGFCSAVRPLAKLADYFFEQDVYGASQIRR